MERPEWAPKDLDVNRPSVARSYDYMLGGAHNFAVDREFSRQVLELMPDAPLRAQINRAFLNRAVRFLVDEGVRQFLDLGSGIPTVGNVHEIAQQRAPDTRVVYVDIDPVAVTHSQMILAGNDRAIAVQEDIRRPEAILEQAETLLDLDQPVGLLLVAVLHYVPDEGDPHAIVDRLCRALCPGSYLVIAHGTPDHQAKRTGEAVGLMSRTSTPARPRPRAEIERFFTGLDLVTPGVVWTSQWRPEAEQDAEDPERSACYVGVARVPER